MVGRIPPDLLGRHVADGAEDDAGAGRRGIRRALFSRSAQVERRPELGQAEVQDLHPPVPGDEQVLGLQVPVDDPLLVGRGQTVCDLDRVVHGFARGQGGVAHHLPQRHAIQQLEHDVGVAFVTAGVEDRDEVGVVEGAGGLRLLFEPAEPVGVGQRVRRQDLDRHLPSEPLVAGAVDLPHPARTENAENLVRAETCPALDCHRTVSEVRPARQEITAPPSRRRRSPGRSRP